METLPQLFLEMLRDDPERVVLYSPEASAPDAYRWRAWTLREVGEQISGLARRLFSLGVSTGVPVAIVAETSHEWIACDLAVLCLGGITVGLYPTLPGDQLAAQLRDSGAQILLVDHAGRLEALAPYMDDLDELVHVFSLHPAPGALPLVPAEPEPGFLAARARTVRPDDVAAVVYTSGTTGASRGALLTHQALAATARASRAVLPIRPTGERSVLYLPMAHILQRSIVYRGLLEGAVGWVSPSLDALPQVLVEARPTLLAAVPRVLEKIRARAEATAAARSPIAAAVLSWAIAVGRSAACAEREGRRPTRRLLAQRAIAERLVFRTIRDRLGGELRLLICGGAALSPDVATWFEAVGIPVREGWGLTETCGAATLSPLAVGRPGSVGPALPGVEVALADDGELLVRGPTLFSGYLNDEAATLAVFTPDGFFRTGDLGAIDADGFVRIVGRKKDLLITAAGKNIAPAPIEQRLQETALVEQAVVIGDGRPYLVALLALDAEALQAWATQADWPGGAETWVVRPEVTAALQAHVEAVNATLAPFETIKRFAALPEGLRAETGELTPTLKVRRAVVAQRHAQQIEALYSRR